MDFSSAFERVEVLIGSLLCLVPPWVVSSDALFIGGKGLVSDLPFSLTLIFMERVGSIALLSVQRTDW